MRGWDVAEERHCSPFPPLTSNPFPGWGEGATSCLARRSASPLGESFSLPEAAIVIAARRRKPYSRPERFSSNGTVSRNRLSASTKLGLIGEAALPYLEQAEKSDAAEVRRWTENLRRASKLLAATLAGSAPDSPLRFESGYAAPGTSMAAGFCICLTMTLVKAAPTAPSTTR